MSHETMEHKAFDRRNEPVAIVGMACNLAGGVDSPRAFWETLVNGEIMLSEKVPKSRFNIDAYFHDKAFGRPGSIASKGGFFLETELNAFDAEFFGISADEANHMDPQQFRILETVYECLESAGKSLQDIKGTDTAVYLGNFSLDKVIASVRHSYDDRHLHEVAGIDPGLLSARVSYFYDLHGPVYTTNAGCTSSMFGLHTAIMALRAGEAPAAIVGGVNLLQGPEAYSSYSKFNIMSPDSMCHPYDARCNGYARAEGIGALYVKLLSDAIRDNDPIRGVVRSVAVTANGNIPDTPLFIPNETGFAKSISLAYSRAALDPADTAYVETHGVGMIPGEIAEAHAIGKFMNHPKRRSIPLSIGALKPNFGHQEASSGIFIVMKAAMMTEAGIIPGHVNFKSAHPSINLEELNIKPQEQTIDWPKEFPIRRVGVCSYGWTGTNAHSIIESVQTLHPEYRLSKGRKTADYDHSVARPLLLTFSACKSSSLQDYISVFCQHADEFYAADLAYTLNLRRSKFDIRAVAIVDGTSKSLGNEIRQSLRSGSVMKGQRAIDIVFSFHEPTTDLIALALELKNHFAVFVSSMRAHGIESQELKMDLNPTVDTLAAIQMALIDLLSDWNVRPSALVQSDTTAFRAARTKLGSVPCVSAISSEAKDAAVTIDLGHIQDFASLLSLAGEAFIVGVPVDLQKVNTSESVTWKPLYAADLPHYAWDHSKTFSNETHANLDFNQNGHAYHPLLGRRVPGLSPSNFVWRNKLSFKDLPDSMPPKPKARPATTLAAAEFISIVAEALNQGFGGATHTSWHIRNFRLYRPLHYEADVNLIEIHTSVSKVADGLYRVAIDSVKEGAWTTHCDATMLEAFNGADSPQNTASEAVMPPAPGLDLGNGIPLEELNLQPGAICLGSEPVVAEVKDSSERYYAHPNVVSTALEVAARRVSKLTPASCDPSELLITDLTIFSCEATLGGKFLITIAHANSVKVTTCSERGTKPVMLLEGLYKESSCRVSTF